MPEMASATNATASPRTTLPNDSAIPKLFTAIVIPLLFSFVFALERVFLWIDCKICLVDSPEPCLVPARRRTPCAI